MEKVQAKFNRTSLGLKYKDEDGGLVSIMDESDWDSGEFIIIFLLWFWC
jgi:hypothetical protein